MTKSWIRRIGIAVVFTIGTAHGHHSGSMYDTSQVVRIQGTVASYEWANPHVYVVIEEETDAGNVIEWEIELLPPSVMTRIGWPRETIAIGDDLAVSGNPARAEGRYALMPVSVQRGDTTLFEQLNSMTRLSSAGADPEQSAHSLEGNWETLLSLEVIMPLVIPTIELTSKGTNALSSYVDSEMNPGADCVAHSAPLFMIDPDLKRITIEDGLIVIAGSSAGDERRIHLNTATHERAVPTNQGHSIGHWEGDTLVIDTTHFEDHRIGNAYVGVPSGSRKHLVERLRINEDRRSLTYSFELTDTEYLAEPVTGSVVWAYRPDIEFTLEECDLGNARRFVGD